MHSNSGHDFSGNNFAKNNFGCRIVVVGCSGSGKSTLSRELGTKLNLPVVHLDKLFWKKGWQMATEEEFTNKHNAAIAAEKWVMDGSYSRTMPERFARADAVVVLDFPMWLCLYRVVRRVFLHSGQTRIDMTEGCIEKIDWEFVQYILNYRKDNRPKNFKILSDAKKLGKKTVLLKTPQQVQRFLASF